MVRFAKLAAVVAMPALMVLAACSDDDPPATQSTGSAAVVPVAGSGSAVPAQCAGTQVAATTPGGASLTLTGAVAASVQNGAAYTLYLTDFPIGLDDFSTFRNPTVPETGTLFTVAITIFNPPAGTLPALQAGQEVQAGRPFGELTFVVTTNEGATFNGLRTGEQGTVTLSAVGNMLCGTIQFSDNLRSLNGTFQAATKPV